MLCSYPLPIVVYLDDIAIYRDTQEKVLEYMLEAIKWLTTAGFVLNLHEPVDPGSGLSSWAFLDFRWLLSA